MRSTRVLHLARLVGTESFGIGPVVLGLASAQQSLGLQIEVWAQDPEPELEDLERFYGLLPGTLKSFPRLGSSRMGISPWMEREVIRKADHFDIIHQHGFWSFILRVTNRWHARTGGTTIVAPHGALDAWALRKSFRRKRIALKLYGLRNLKDAACLHALSLREAKAFRLLGLENPVAILPNGVPGKLLSRSGDRRRFRRKFEVPESVRIMLFLGRITPKKGLPLLLHAMGRIRNLLNDWRLIVAGEDEFRHRQEVELVIEQLGLRDLVNFIGPVYGQDKLDAYAAADVFVLTSYSEGSPIAILEALGAGVPVLTTKSSPWEELVTRNCGWWVDISVDTITQALREIVNSPKQVLNAMGKKGKILVAEKYTWNEIAKRTIQLYEWIVGKGKQPDFVMIPYAISIHDGV